MSENNSSNTAGILAGIAAIIVAIGGIAVPIITDDRQDATSKDNKSELDDNDKEQPRLEKQIIPKSCKEIDDKKDGFYKIDPV